MIDRRTVAASLLALSLAPLSACAGPNELVETVADGLDHPWSLAFLPDGTMLVTERAGNLRTIGMDRRLSEPISGLPQVAAVGQGGLLDIALHPKFEQTRLVFLSFAEPREEGKNATSVMRGRLSEDLRSLTDVKVIFRQQPAAEGGQHFGSRLVFDPTGALFVTTGDRLNLRPLVQRTDNHIGKIIRITEDGGIPPDNPKVEGWLPEIWSIGHRNLQGAAIHPETGRLWTVEHGAKGGDELNHPEAGKNYGWPVITYSREYSGEPIGGGLTAKDGMEQPVHYWTPSIGPSGMAFYTSDRYPQWKGNLFVGALALKHLARLVLKDGKVVEEQRLYDGRARIRDVRQGPDGYLYMLTDEDAPMGRVVRVTP
ncbi:PQQ-dependent sugar dehydrogenase [Aestuariivirga sp.]|uniref:PQQ-dependent sugar dehydrogenase n=1 Tax=Aestuariivirga sp. TaxID=2650926 RepID=UPI0025BDDB33|nr:PQQ-dependent sugar dehydrogenase [Aestuariivirga sp.]MCA3555880.1 PQQ-dependent sugar dehydrogenase [Aestuariivirga sp.]